MTNKEITVRLAQCFIERAKELQYKGVKRDNAALDYWVGAATLARETGQQELAGYLSLTAALIISVRGYTGIVQLTKLEKEAA